MWQEISILWMCMFFVVLHFVEEAPIVTYSDDASYRGPSPTVAGTTF